jgi:hypothetical protein
MSDQLSWSDIRYLLCLRSGFFSPIQIQIQFSDFRF